MLDFIETEDHFIIKESILSFYGTQVKLVIYTKDLQTKKINSEPWQETSKSDVDWFNKHYRKKF